MVSIENRMHTMVGNKKEAGEYLRKYSIGSTAASYD